MGGKVLQIGGRRSGLGRAVDLEIPAGHSSTGRDVTIPVRVVRGAEPGPVVAVTAAVHGDEINGTAIVRGLISDDAPELLRGSLILAPVINVLGFERTTRYMPDRRDLNRSFPGSAEGSLTARFAHAVFEQIVRKADWLIDLHAAAARRTNFPNARADLDDPRTAELARHFDLEMTVHGAGPEGSLRRAAVSAGIPTLILEAGEVWKFEPSVTEAGLRGVRNALIGLGMVAGEPAAPLFRAVSRKTSWVRAPVGGILRFHASAGLSVERGDALATVTTVLGKELATVLAPMDGVVLGMTTMPAVVPGDPVYHIASVEGGIQAVRSARRGGRGEGTLDGRMRDELSTNVSIEEHGS